MANRLIHEKSPYLLQHANNPVDWYPWGPEAFERARREDKPVLVSIGYSACHWCHVMEHESFENSETASLMNDRFVNIKVDREERPDVDSIYMEAVQGMTGQGGWPLNVFVTPDGQPFFGGTYFPPRPGRGMPSWRQVLESLSSAYQEQRAEVVDNADRVTAYLRQAQNLPQSADELTSDLLAEAYRSATQQFDWQHGGFGGAPKFPQPLSLEFVLRMHRRLQDDEALRFAALSLRSMAEGGIFDHLGGGFHRYTVDGQWVVPHFEKMLYDNALLVRVYLQMFQITHDPYYARVVEQTLEYLMRDMRSPEGGFFSAEDADSEGVEGKYYVWTPEEIESVLSPDEARIVRLYYGVTPHGNFEGKTILTVSETVDAVARTIGRSAEEVERLLTSARATLLRARSERIPPGKDTKILTSWNALAIRAFCEAGAVLGRPDYLTAAREAADFLLTALRPAGSLVRSYRDGPSAIPAFLEDYAFLVEALVSLYETSCERRFIDTAQELAREMVRRFWDSANGVFYDTQSDASDLVVRPRSLYDNPIPSGSSSAAFGLLRLEALTGERWYADHALPSFRSLRDVLARAPLGFSYLLCALDFYLSTPLQIAVVGEPGADETKRMLRAIHDRYLPNRVLAVGLEESVPLLEGRPQLGGQATAYVCRHFTCRLPVTRAPALAEQLDTSAVEAS